MIRKRILIIILILLLTILLALLGRQFFEQQKKDVLAQSDWIGVWEVYYFYDNANQLLYNGSLHFNYKDTLSGYLEIFPPKSTRTEMLILQDLQVSEDGGLIRGQLVHDQYKINGGYMRERFEFELEAPNQFKGRGQCLEFCAEGTKEAKIIWQANKKENQ